MIFTLDSALTNANRSSTGVRAIDAHTTMRQLPQACLTLALSEGM